VDALSFELNRSICDLPDLHLQKPGNGLESGTFASPIGSQKGYDTPCRDLQRNSFEDEDHLMIFDFNII
jgi:hypothetical protein